MSLQNHNKQRENEIKSRETRRKRRWYAHTIFSRSTVGVGGIFSHIVHADMFARLPFLCRFPMQPWPKLTNHNANETLLL